ncbi:hypothetical protein MC885_018087 [Smutsia gigantea]|nr:hypothetical protein MC885_018087 [Smutsia gigantea]
MACGCPGANGLPGKDRHDSTKRDKGEAGQGLRGLQGPPGKLGPKESKGPLRYQEQWAKKGILEIVQICDSVNRFSADFPSSLALAMRAAGDMLPHALRRDELL